MVAWGGGVDSSALLVEMVERGEPVDQVLIADTGDEHPAFYDHVPRFTAWLTDRNVPVAMVRASTSRFQNGLAYRTMGESLLANATLPSICYGRGACSQRWKAAPQHQWLVQWQPAVRAWRHGMKVVKIIGYDCSPRDSRRYAEQADINDPLYSFRFPLREWGWDRDRCQERLAEAGFENVRKSACVFCLSAKPDEVRSYDRRTLRRIVLIEARAKPRLRTVEGLWRRATSGARGTTPRPGSMTKFIADEGLLDRSEIERIEIEGTSSFAGFQDEAIEQSGSTGQSMSEWLDAFDLEDWSAMRRYSTNRAGRENSCSIAQ